MTKNPDSPAERRRLLAALAALLSGLGSGPRRRRRERLARRLEGFTESELLAACEMFERMVAEDFGTSPSGEIRALGEELTRSVRRAVQRAVRRAGRRPRWRLILGS